MLNIALGFYGREQIDCAWASSWSHAYQ